MINLRNLRLLYSELTWIRSRHFNCNASPARAATTHCAKLPLLFNNQSVTQLCKSLNMNCFSRWSIYCYHRAGPAKSKLISRISGLTTIQVHKSRTDGRTRLDETRKRVQETRKKVAEARQVVREQLEKKFDGMRENVMTIPNALCVARIASTPLLGYYVVTEQFALALSVGVFAAITDFVSALQHREM